MFGGGDFHRSVEEWSLTPRRGQTYSSAEGLQRLQSLHRVQSSLGRTVQECNILAHDSSCNKKMFARVEFERARGKPGERHRADEDEEEEEMETHPL